MNHSPLHRRLGPPPGRPPRSSVASTRRPAPLVAALPALALLAGCTMLPMQPVGVAGSEPVSGAPASAVAARGAGRAAAPTVTDAAEGASPAGPALRAPATPRAPYLRVQPQQTGLVNAADDGRHTVIAFDRPVPPEFSAWDQDGNPLRAVRAGAVVAVAGLHRGILVRTPAGNSYLAPNPRATAADRPHLEGDPEAQEALSRLEGEASQMQAFQRALSRVEAVGAAIGPAGPPPSSVAAVASAPGAARQEDDLTYQRLPGGALIRVFFASGGRTIVRPDDGLHRLERAARDARSIRITGFADATGSSIANQALASARADAIRVLLQQRGVPAERITVAAVAAGQYLGDNESERGRALNRRVEVLVLGGER